MLIIGGRRGVINSGDVQHVLTAEFFDIDTETFSPGGNTAIEAIRTAFLMPTGKVFTLNVRGSGALRPSHRYYHTDGAQYSIESRLVYCNHAQRRPRCGFRWLE